ncbi:MAG: XRE family transcriptional regulator [Clostridiales bacterium]|nr:XRE family transcriptional regulator [Clostridiales bacterium]
MGRRLRYFRESLGLSQLELSLRSNVSQASIARIEANQQKNPKKETIEKLAAALGISLSQLIEEPAMIKEEAPSYGVPKMLPVVKLEDFINFIPLKRFPDLKEKASLFEPSLSHDHSAFFLIATEALISPLINKGDLLLIEPSSKVKNGDIILFISNEQNTVGRIFYRPAMYILQPLKESEPIFLKKKEREKLGVRILKIGEIRKKY